MSIRPTFSFSNVQSIVSQSRLLKIDDNKQPKTATTTRIKWEKNKLKKMLTLTTNWCVNRIIWASSKRFCAIPLYDSLRVGHNQWRIEEMKKCRKILLYAYSMCIKRQRQRLLLPPYFRNGIDFNRKSNRVTVSTTTRTTSNQWQSVGFVKNANRTISHWSKNFLVWICHFTQIFCVWLSVHCAVGQCKSTFICFAPIEMDLFTFLFNSIKQKRMWQKERKIKQRAI